MTRQLRTTKCSAFGHPEFALEYSHSGVLESDVAWLRDYLENAVAAGTRFRPTETIQVGWMVDSIDLLEPGLLLLQEPDFRGVPVKFERGVSRTLRDLRTQRDMIEGLQGGDPMFPSIRHSAIVCNRLHRGIGVLERDNPDSADSGWFVGCNDPQHDHSSPVELVRESLYAVVCHSSAPELIIPFLALPPGWRVDVKPNRCLAFTYNGKARAPLRGSFPEVFAKRVAQPT